MVDRRTQVRLVVAVAALAVAAAVAVLLTTRLRSRASAGSASNPVVLVLSPAHADDALADQLGAALSSASGLRVEVRRSPSREAALQQLRMPDVDGGVLPLLEYLLARQELGVEAALQLVRAGGARDQVGVLVVREGGPVYSASALGGMPVAFVDRSSTTGYLLAARHLAEQGVKVDPVFTGDHQASLDLLKRGEVVAAATYEHAVAGLRVVARVGAAPNEPVFFHHRLPAATRAKVAAAFSSLASTEEGQALLARMAGTTGLAPVTDAAYADVTAVLAATQHELADVVPGGRRLVRQLREPEPRPLGD